MVSHGPSSGKWFILGHICQILAISLSDHPTNFLFSFIKTSVRVRNKFRTFQAQKVEPSLSCSLYQVQEVEITDERINSGPYLG